MNLSRLTALPLLCALFFAGLANADEVTVNYKYTLDPQVDFSKAPKGALNVADFTDARDVADPRAMSDYMAEMPVAEMVNDALTQAFVAGEAGLVSEGQSFTLNGEVTEFSIEETDSGFDVIVRTHATLRAGSRTAFDAVIFGRANAATVEAAISGALDKLVHSLIWDDYFLMEVI